MVFIDAFILSLPFAVGALGTAFLELSLKGAAQATICCIIGSFIYATIKYIRSHKES